MCACAVWHLKKMINLWEKKKPKRFEGTLEASQSIQVPHSCRSFSDTEGIIKQPQNSHFSSDVEQMPFKRVLHLPPSLNRQSEVRKYVSYFTTLRTLQKDTEHQGRLRREKRDGTTVTMWGEKEEDAIAGRCTTMVGQKRERKGKRGAGEIVLAKSSVGTIQRPPR